MEVTCFMQGEFYVWFGWGGTLLEWSPASYKAHEARVERIWLHQALRPSRYFLVELWIALAYARVLPCIYLSDDRFRLVSRTCHNTRWKKEDLKSFGLIAEWFKSAHLNILEMVSNILEMARTFFFEQKGGKSHVVVQACLRWVRKEFPAMHIIYT